MGRHFNLFIWILMLKSTKEQVLFDDLDDRRQNFRNSVMHFAETKLQQLTKSFEKMLLQKFEEIEDNLQTKISRELGNMTKNVVDFTNIVENKLACHPILISGSGCADILKRCPNTRGRDGVYNIMDVSDKMKAVYCDMTTDNGGWTVIQRRINGSVDFYRNWIEYKNGFGFADHEYWIGNDMLHRMSSVKPHELRVEMQRFNGENAYAVYSDFSVEDEASKYKLKVNGYNGNAGDSLSYNRNMKFTTRDQDNDGLSGSNCAALYTSAGWFNNCGYANPNGPYTDSETNGYQYIVWTHWKDSPISLKTMQLMIRPRA